jgi:hypothetical protein
MPDAFFLMSHASEESSKADQFGGEECDCGKRSKVRRFVSQLRGGLECRAGDYVRNGHPSLRHWPIAMDGMPVTAVIVLRPAIVVMLPAVSILRTQLLRVSETN